MYDIENLVWNLEVLADAHARSASYDDAAACLREAIGQAERLPADELRNDEVLERLRARLRALDPSGEGDLRGT